MKKDALEEMKQKDKCKIGTNDLEKLINDKLRKKFLDRLKNNNNIKNVCYKLEKFINDKLKKDAFVKLKNIKKGLGKLDKFIVTYIMGIIYSTNN